MYHFIEMKENNNHSTAKLWFDISENIEFIKLNNKIISEFLLILKKKYTQEYYSRFFSDIKLKKDIQSNIKDNSDKRKIRQLIVETIDLKLGEIASKEKTLQCFYLKNIFEVYYYIIFNRTSVDLAEIKENFVNYHGKESVFLFDFLVSMIDLKEAQLFYDEFKNIIDVNIINIADLISKENNSVLLFSLADIVDYNPIIIDHLQNIQVLFDKKSIICYIILLSNKLLSFNLFKNSKYFNNFTLLFENFSECANKDLKKLINTLLLSPFHQSDHFKHAKSFIKKTFGLNNFGYSKLIKSNSRIKYFSGLDQNSFFINLNNKNSNNSPINKIYHIHHNNTALKIDKKQNLDDSQLLSILKNKLNISKQLSYDDSYYDCEEFFTKDNNILSVFVNENKHKTIFSQNLSSNSLNNNAHSNDLYNFDYLFLSERYHFQKLIGQIIPNMYLNTNKEYLLFFNNILFFHDNFYLLRFDINYYIVCSLIDEFIKLKPFNSDLLFINEFIFSEFTSSSDFLTEEISGEIESLRSEYQKNILTTKLINNFNEIKKWTNLLINKISLYFPDEKKGDLYFFRKLIYILTDTVISDYYPGVCFTSFCIEFYLVHLFEKHYQRQFDHTNETDLKYISKIAEKYHSCYSVLIKKSFEYTEDKYKLFCFNFRDEKAKSFDIINEKLKIKNFNNYNAAHAGIIIKNFVFKPLIKLIDFYTESRIMHNCLTLDNRYTHSKDSVVFLVTHLNNKKFRINFQVLITDCALISEGPYTYHNKDNTLLQNEFVVALEAFLKQVNSIL